jgi:hypothetical protein
MYPRFRKSFVVLAIGAALVSALPAVAQTAWRTPSGRFAATVPAQMTALAPDANRPEGGSFVLMTAGVRKGFCTVNVSKPITILSSEAWSGFAAQYAGDGEAHVREATEKGGYTFVRYGGDRTLTSAAGWSGYFIWFERHKNTGSQTTINAATMLAEDARLVVVCSSLPGKLLSPADIEAAHRFASSFRKL